MQRTLARPHLGFSHRVLDDFERRSSLRINATVHGKPQARGAHVFAFSEKTTGRGTKVGHVVMLSDTHDRD